MLEFLDEALETFNGIGEVQEALDNSLWELVGQCAFTGSDAMVERLDFVFKLKNMVLLLMTITHDLSMNQKLCSQPQCQNIKTHQDFHDFLFHLREVFRLHDGKQYVDLSGGNLKQQ
jgi:hypothetical protein